MRAEGPEQEGEAWWTKTKFSGVSESKGAFTAKPLERREDVRVVQNPVGSRPNVKFDGVSESRSQFTPKEPTRDEQQQDFGPQENWWEKTKFSGQSEAAAQFTPKPVERDVSPTKQAKPVTRSFAKFEAVSESRSAYTPKAPDPVMRAGAQEQEGEPWWEKTTFKGESESRAQFTPKPFDARTDVKVDVGKMKVHRATVNLEPAIGEVRDSQDSTMMRPF